MRHHRTQAGSDEHRRIERAIVLTLMAEDHDERWPRDELAASLHADRSTLDGAVERLRDTASCCSTARTCSPRRVRGGSMRWS
jgi:hypothetical protein